MNKIDDYRVSLYEEIRQAPPEIVKELDQKEREIVWIALRSLRYKDYVLNADQSQQLSSIINKLISLHVEPISKEVPWYQQIGKMISSVGKGILNLLQLRTSSHQILKEARQVTLEKQELEKISADLQQKNAELRKYTAELQETPYFLYKDLVKMYENLPGNSVEAQLVIDDEIEKMEEKLGAAEAELKGIEQKLQAFKLEAAREASQWLYQGRKEVLTKLIRALKDDILLPLRKQSEIKSERRFSDSLRRKREFLLTLMVGSSHSSPDELEKKISVLKKEIGKLEKRQGKLQERLNDKLVG